MLFQSLAMALLCSNPMAYYNCLYCKNDWESQFFNWKTKFLCSQNQELNNQLKWLFSSSTALYPSLYMYDQQSSNKDFAYGRLEEAFRLATWVSKEKKRQIPVFPYFRHLYEGKPLEFDYLTDVRYWILCYCNLHYLTFSLQVKCETCFYFVRTACSFHNSLLEIWKCGDTLHFLSPINAYQQI